MTVNRKKINNPKTETAGNETLLKDAARKVHHDVDENLPNTIAKEILIQVQKYDFSFKSSHA